MTQGNLWAVVRERGVVLKTGREHSPAASRVRTTFAKQTIRRLMDRHGEDHVGKVLDAILGDERGHQRNREGNAAELYAATITAVSELLARHPHLAAGKTNDLLRDLDLGAVRRKALKMNAGPVWQTMLALMTLALIDDGADEAWLREEAA